MKRILSVILSLALLASLLIIPMSVSAGEVDNNHQVVQFVYNDDNKATYYSPDRNVSLGITPYVYVTDNTATTPARYQITNANIPKLSTGTFSGNDIRFDGQGFYFRKKGADNTYSGDPLNGYVLTNPLGDFDFDQESFEGYVDIIYDLGAVIDINKVQHFSNQTDLSTGAYSFYAAVSAEDLFKSESKVFVYQNKNYSAGGCQQHTFDSVNARYAAFRIYYPIVYTSNTGKDYYNTLRIKELAIYGTKTNAVDYKVTEIQAPTGGEGAPESVPTGDLLNSGTLESIKSFENGNLVRTDENLYKPERNLGRLNSQTYYNGGHGDFNLDVVFYANNTCKNGYSIDRTNTNGNIVFNVPTEDPKVYYDFTYDLGDYHKITSFGAYLCSNEDRRIQAYEVYIGNDRDSLYTGEPVVVYNNYYNTYGQMITFDKAKVGKYIGFRVLNPGTANDDGNTYVRLDELAAYGTRVGTPPAINVEKGCGSAEVTVTLDENNTIDSVTVSKDNAAAENKTLDENGKFSITGIGDYTVVATDDKGNVTTKEITVADHNYKYTAKDNVITETCANCDRPAETLTLTKPATIVYDSNDKSGSIDVVKMTGFANAAGKGDIVFKNGETTVTEVKDAGNYVAELTIEGVTARLPFTIQQANLDPQDYPAPTVDDIEAGSTLGSDAFGANDKGAFTWAKPDTKVEYGSHTYKATFTPTNDNYKTVENIDVTVNGKDTTAPTGEIKIKETVWDKLANLFIKDRETVTITGSDAGSGVKAVYYYVADAAVDTATIEESAWKPYTDPFKIEKEGNNFVYAKIVDVAGNVTVISTDGIVLDTKAPSADVTNLGKYYGSLTVTVKDDNLDTVKLDGKDVTLDEEGKFVVDAADGAQKIVITDKAGNETTYTVTVVEVKGFNPAEGKLTVDMDEKNVDKEKIAEKIEKGETVTFFDISVDNATGSTANVLEVPVDFDFTGKLNVRVLHNHGGNVNELKALTARPTAGFENGTFFADKENGKLYIYSKEFSPFAVAFHVHDVKHVEAKAATAEADGNIEYWYCEGCDKYFSDAAATKEIQKADTVVKYVAPSNGNTGSGSNAPTTGGETENNATVPGGTSPVTGETAMTVVLFAILLGALAVMGISIVKSRKAKSK